MDEMIKKNISSNLIVGQLDEEYIQNLEENFHVGIKRFFDIMSNTVNKDKNESEEI